MATRVRDLLSAALGSLRYEPVEKRLRVYLAGELVADTVAGLLIWEPRRIVPTYAVPDTDFSAQLQPAAQGELSAEPTLTPANPFGAHTCKGRVFDVIVEGMRRPAAAFRADDPDLAGSVILDFNAFQWREEAEQIVAHPHDPFKRIDVLASRRHIRIESGGRVLAESSDSMLLFETLLPVRFYLPRTDVVADLEPTDTITYCAYKGRAAYFSVSGGPTDVAWSYYQPLPDAEPVRDRIAFFDERVDVIVDGQRRQRPVTHFAR